MVKTKKAFWASLISAIIILIIYFISYKTINSPGMVGFIVTLSVFLIGFIGMKFSDWMKKW